MKLIEYILELYVFIRSVVATESIKAKDLRIPFSQAGGIVLLIIQFWPKNDITSNFKYHHHHHLLLLLLLPSPPSPPRFTSSSSLNLLLLFLLPSHHPPPFTSSSSSLHLILLPSPPSPPPSLSSSSSLQLFKFGLHLLHDRCPFCSAQTLILQFLHPYFPSPIRHHFHLGLPFVLPPPGLLSTNLLPFHLSFSQHSNLRILLTGTISGDLNVL